MIEGIAAWLFLLATGVALLVGSLLVGHWFTLFLDFLHDKLNK